jgi:hypothetical protein
MDKFVIDVNDAGFEVKKQTDKKHSKFFQLGALEDLFVIYNQQFQQHSLAVAQLQGRRKAKAESQDEASSEQIVKLDQLLANFSTIQL